MDRTFRIIIDDARGAAFNMAADLMLLDRAARESRIAIRFYSWAPPAISLGCSQNAEPVLDRDELSRHGIDVAVRPTGGRAVLHWNDLTYSCVFPLDAVEMGGSIHESYAVIGACLKRGFAHAGIRCETHDSGAEYAATRRDSRLPCFLAPNRNEIMVQGRKLVGSAQKRTGDAVLQHGSIPLDGSFRRLPDFMAIPPEERSRQRALLEKKCACVREIDPAIDEKMLTKCLVRGFTDTLPFAAFERRWDEEELNAIRGLSGKPTGEIPEPAGG